MADEPLRLLLGVLWRAWSPELRRGAKRRGHGRVDRLFRRLAKRGSPDSTAKTVEEARAIWERIDGRP